MRIPPLLAASALLFAGAMAFAVTVVVRHRQGRIGRSPSLDVEETPRAVRADFPTVAAPPSSQTAAVVEARSLRVHVIGPHGLSLASIQVWARPPANDRDDDSDDDDEENLISLDDDETPGLHQAEVSADRYDVEITAAGMRRVELKHLAAGDPVVDVQLEREPILLGAIGGRGAPGCAGVTLSLSDVEGEGEADIELDEETCAFAVSSLPERPFTVVADDGQRIDRALVTVPVSGDPPAVCLMGPCDTAPASLLIYLVNEEGVPTADASVEWSIDNGGDGRMGMRMVGGPHFFLPNQPVGQVLELTGTQVGAAVTATVVIAPGLSELVLTLVAVDPAPEPEPIADEGCDFAKIAAAFAAHAAREGRR